MSTTRTQTSALVTIISVFFFWGFVAASNDILIPVFKGALDLTQVESQMISFAFYVAYTVGSLIYFGISRISGQDILNRIGYRNGLSLGLLISAAGTLLFIPAANSSSFPLLITGLFIVGLGFSLQQTAANTIMIVLGDPAKASQRLSMAGGINNIGTTIGPVIIAFAIFGSASSASTTLDLQSVKLPYIALGIAFVIVAAIFRFSSVPDRIEAITGDTAKSTDVRKSPFAYPQLVLGMIAIFVYVGVEVSTASNLPEFMRIHLGMESHQVAPYVSLFWASLMIGRWTSAAGAFGIGPEARMKLNLVLPIIAFSIFLLVNFIAGSDVTIFYQYLFLVFVLIAADSISEGNPVRQLLLYSILGIAALVTGIFATGVISAYSFIAVGLFCSTLWPCIFTIAIHDLGKHTNEGASLLIMMIMGGGFVSLLQGYLADDALLGIQHSYWVGVVCFAYLAFYAWRMRGMTFTDVKAVGH
ncbi:MAG: MFS transporter [Flavobacteriales bacterium]|jgi:FHS family L-fucose permease-like MFS transporter